MNFLKKRKTLLNVTQIIFNSEYDSPLITSEMPVTQDPSTAGSTCSLRPPNPHPSCNLSLSSSATLPPPTKPGSRAYYTLPTETGHVYYLILPETLWAKVNCYFINEETKAHRGHALAKVPHWAVEGTRLQDLSSYSLHYKYLLHVDGGSDACLAHTGT